MTHSVVLSQIFLKINCVLQNLNKSKTELHLPKKWTHFTKNLQTLFFGEALENLIYFRELEKSSGNKNIKKGFNNTYYLFYLEGKMQLIPSSELNTKVIRFLFHYTCHICIYTTSKTAFRLTEFQPPPLILISRNQKSQGDLLPLLHWKKIRAINYM